MQMQSIRSARNRVFRIRQRGQGMTEYIIITALIAIAAIAAVSYFGKTARNQIAGMSHELSGTTAAGDITNAQAAATAGATDANKQKGLSNYKNDAVNSGN